MNCILIELIKLFVGEKLMETKLVSIILPIFNIEDNFLKKCVESLLKQTYKNIEIILIDDGSTNNIIDVCLSLQKSDSRVKVHKQVNSGVSVARNKGLEVSSGKYICFVDPDDWVSEDYISDLVEAIENANADFSVSNCFINYKDNNQKNDFLQGESRVLTGAQKNELLYQLVGKKLCRYYPKGIAAGVPWCKMFNRDFLEKNNLEFVPGMKRMQDNIFCLYAFENAKKIAYTKKNNYYYREDENSASHKYSTDIISNFETYFDETFKFLDKYGKEDLMYQAVYMKELTSFNSFFARYFFNEKNTKKFGNIKNEIEQLLETPRYKNALANINYKLLNNQEKIFVFCLRHRFFRILKLLIRLKNR